MSRPKEYNARIVCHFLKKMEVLLKKCWKGIDEATDDETREKL
jgi:hypothetical protein